jgi:hypothetical protein
MMMLRASAIAGVLSVLLLVLVSAGCGDAATTADVAVEVPETGSEAGSLPIDRGSVLVLGRSVMTGWMAHWGGDASTTAVFDGHEVQFREIEGPPGIAQSAVEAMGSAPVGSTVLFKYCFVDFNGGDYAGELDAYMRDIERVADEANRRGLRLILGTALPKVRGESTPELVAEHREFGARVERFVGQRRAAGQAVAVLDLNAVLTDDDGALDRRFAVSGDDSHLNETAYDTLDEALRPLLAERP